MVLVGRWNFYVGMWKLFILYHIVQFYHIALHSHNGRWYTDKFFIWWQMQHRHTVWEELWATDPGCAEWCHYDVWPGNLGCQLWPGEASSPCWLLPWGNRWFVITSWCRQGWVNTSGLKVWQYGKSAAPHSLMLLCYRTIEMWTIDTKLSVQIATVLVAVLFFC